MSPTTTRRDRPVVRRTRVSTSKRLQSIRLALALALVLLAVRLAQIQVLEHQRYAALSISQVRQTIVTPALRGGIYDRYGQTLAVSRPTSLVIADDFQITDPLAESRALSPLVHVGVATLDRLLSRHSGYVVVTRTLDVLTGRRITAMNFPGIVVQRSSVRSYPNGTLATSLLGVWERRRTHTATPAGTCIPQSRPHE